MVTVFESMHKNILYPHSMYAFTYGLNTHHPLLNRIYAYVFLS